MHVNTHLNVVVVVVSCYFLPQGACGDEAADTDSDVLALEDGAGTKINNQLLVLDSAVMMTPGT